MILGASSNQNSSMISWFYENSYYVDDSWVKNTCKDRQTMLERPTFNILNQMHQNHCCLSVSQCVGLDNNPKRCDTGMLEAVLVFLGTTGDTTLSDALTLEQTFPCPFILRTFAWQWAMCSLLIRNEHFLPFVFNHIISGAIAHCFHERQARGLKVSEFSIQTIRSVFDTPPPPFWPIRLKSTWF